jgi:hypothetical protein
MGAVPICRKDATKIILFFVEKKLALLKFIF